MSAKTYYEILEVEPTATAEEIKQSRRLLRAAWHPDKFKGTNKKQAEEKFKDIEQAYDVLSNSQKRAVYDSNLAHQRSAEANHQHAQEAQQKQEEERRQRQAEEAQRKREAEERAAEERRRREEESRQRENRHYGARPNYPPESVAHTTGTNSGLWLTLSIIIMAVILSSLLIAFPTSMGIWSWILFGLITGVITKLLTPGRDPGGCIITMLLGIAGAFVGGFIFELLTGQPQVMEPDLGSLVVSVIGAIVVLLIFRLISGRRA